MNNYTSFYKYLETLKIFVDQQLSIPQTKDNEDKFKRLKVLLNSDSIPKFVDKLSQNKVSISESRTITEIDNILDEFHIKGFNLPEPEALRITEQRKADREQRVTLLILILGLCGFEWVHWFAPMLGKAT